MSNELKNILIMKPSALGDIVLALPALLALRKSFPKAKISWLVRPEFAPLLENHPSLDEQFSADAFYTASASFGYDLKLIIKYFSQVLGIGLISTG